MTPRAEAPPHRLDARLRTSLVAVAASGAALTAGSLVLFGARAGLSSGMGVIVAVGNLWALARIVTALLPDDAEGARAQSRGAWTLLASIKVLGLLAMVGLLMRSAVVSPLALLVGFGALPMGIAIGSLVSDRNAA